MFRNKKDEWHDGERYPEGRQNAPFGVSAAKHKKRKKSRPARSSVSLPHINWQLDRSVIEKCFLVSIFVVIEVMICRVFFGVFESVFDGLNLPEGTRGVIKLAQLAMFLVFSYANIMLCFFKTNIFE